MDSALRDVVHDLVIGGTARGNRPEGFRRGARAILTEDIRELLAGHYGVHADGRLEPRERLPHLAGDPDGLETLRRIHAHVAAERAAGVSAGEAVMALIREAAFTHLNRLVAFKMLEARGLLRATLRGFPRPNGLLHWLAAHEEEERRWNAGEEDDAFRRFLLHQAGLVAGEVRVLFDPDSLASRTFPRPAALREVIGMLNHGELEPAWREDETIGWVYQYFNEAEKADVFNRLYKQKQKIRREDIPAATQLFTPRWIVEFLVQNTLGRLWLQMHPDSHLAERMPYLVPPASELPREPLKPVREIAVLDPACGTMHFGLVAFDLLAEMYREEREHAGEPGWPSEPSARDDAEAAAAIVAHNLHGIDIDLRAVQLAALTLYLKAKSLAPAARLTASNLVPADVLPFREADLEAFLAESRFTRPIYERVLRALWPKLREVSDLGSLARLERDLDAILQRERAARAKEERENPLLVDVMGGHGPALAAEDQWRALEDHIVWALDHYARTMAERGADVTVFAGEAAKGLRLLDLMRRRYDVVLTNPPYLTNFTDTMKAALARDYPIAKSDTYAAFIVRCVEWLRDGGRVGMITQQSFMFQSSYQKFRDWFLDSVAVESVAHLAAGAFDEISGEVVSTVSFAVRLEAQEQQRRVSAGQYVRLVDDLDKRVALLKRLEVDDGVYRICQAEYDHINGRPMAYWVSKVIIDLVAQLPRLDTKAEIRVGLQTSDNDRFLRYWWEIGVSAIAFDASGDSASSRVREFRWYPYMKGGASRKWFGNQQYVVNWGNGGEEIKSWINPASGLPYSNVWMLRATEGLFFKEGITWTVITSGNLSARWMPSGYIIGHKGPAVFLPDHADTIDVLGLLNSTLGSAVLQVCSPGAGFERGHIAAFPIPGRSSRRLTSLVEKAIGIQRSSETQVEESFLFASPPHWPRQHENGFFTRLAAIEREIDEEVYRLYGISDEDRAAIGAELRGAAGVALDEQGVADGEEADGEADRPAPLTRQELAVRWVSYALGIVLGRFRPGEDGALGSAVVRDPEDGEGAAPRRLFAPEIEEQLRALADRDGIVVLDAGHPDDVVALVERALALMLGEDEADVVAREAAGGARGGLRGFLERDFFTKWHVRWYRKRPVYWLLQSPKRTWGIYLFHERITRDTLFVVGTRYLQPKLVALGHRIDELAAARDAAGGRERTRLGKEYDAAVAARDDVQEFARLLRAITETAPGYAPDIDDGVILNLAPLWPLLPSWSAEPKKAWQALERGDYDWARIAMRHWPERVLAKCARDKSLAIAHGRMDVWDEGR